MSEREELEARRDELRRRRDELKAELAARATGRRAALATLEAERDESRRQAAGLREELEKLEPQFDQVEEQYQTLSRDTAGAERHLAQLNRK